MPDLVSLEHYKRELKRHGTTAEDDVLAPKLAAAEVMVLEHVSQRLGDDAEDWADTVAAWTEDTAPAPVVAAILELAVCFDRFRGDDEDAPDWMKEGRLPPMVLMKLGRYRDPAIA